MKDEVKVVIFDWGRTLHNPETNYLFDGVPELLENLHKNHDLVLVSLAKSDSPEARRSSIEKSGILEYFKLILVGGENKDDMYEEVLTRLKIMPEAVMIVDDRVIRGIAWGNRRGVKTVWFRNGKFSKETPTKETGNPTFVINKISDLGELFETKK